MGRRSTGDLQGVQRVAFFRNLFGRSDNDVAEHCVHLVFAGGNGVKGVLGNIAVPTRLHRRTIHGRTRRLMLRGPHPVSVYGKVFTFGGYGATHASAGSRVRRLRSDAPRG
jgi:hypothetical protein